MIDEDPTQLWFDLDDGTFSPSAPPVASADEIEKEEDPDDDPWLQFDQLRAPEEAPIPSITVNFSI